jgi:hypothetical protein
MWGRDKRSSLLCDGVNGEEEEEEENFYNF